MTPTTERSDALARAYWQELYQAAIRDDDRELWFAWKRTFPFRFWRALGAAGIGALCERVGLNYSEILRRITAYDMSLDRDTREQEEKLVRDSQKPPPA